MERLKEKIEDLKKHKELQNIEIKIKEFISQFEDYDDKETFIQLLQNYIYLDRKTQQSILHSFFEDIANKKKLEYNKTLYSVIESEEDVKNSSNTLLEEYKMLNNIENQFSIEVGTYKLAGYNLVFFDDVVGSGKTVIEFLEKYLEDLKNVTLYFYILFLTENGRKNIEARCKELNLNVTIVFHKMLGKCLDTIFTENAQLKREQIKKHGKNIYKKSNHKEILGFEDTEIILTTFRNTPNNTIIQFRKDRKNKWESLFPRNQKIIWLEKKDSIDNINRKELANKIGYDEKNK